MAENKQIDLRKTRTSEITDSVLNSSPVIAFRQRVLPKFSENPDLALAVGVIIILMLLILPIPAILLDFFLSINIATSVLIILIAIYLNKPLDFSVFPSILLITTLFRLGLNVASTRLILGEAMAGDIIQAFGSFVIGGNMVVGIIIFIILMVINFVVIIKGSTRIAEVAARFTLDALPGKQMSIDADLNAGYIDEQTAKSRREELTSESDFYGSMDGASKFIKGDAIAGIIITLINLLGGFTIGMLQRDMDFSTALSTYSMLTIGDGLVSQIPSLLISVAGGLVVSRSGSTAKLDIELSEQFTSQPRPLAIGGVVLFAMAFLPGFPFAPFLLLSTVAGGAAYLRGKRITEDADEVLRKELQEAEREEKADEEKPVEELLKIDPVEIELGYSLISMVDETQGGDVFKRITNVRRQLAGELGIIIPPVRVRDNLQLEPEKYIVKIRGNDIAENILFPNMLLAMNPGTAEGKLQGRTVTEPVFGLPATWIPQSQRENAEVMGYTVVESATVLTTHLTELLRRNADKLVSRQDINHLVENLKEDYPTLIEEVKPESLPMSVIQRVVQNLLKESVPVKDLPMIIESLLDYYKITQNVDVLTEYVRHNLADTLKKMYEDSEGVIHAIGIDPNLEDIMNDALSANQSGVISQSMGLTPDLVNNILDSINNSIDEVTVAGHLPVIICSAQIRPYFHKMISTNYPMVSVISYTELPTESEVDIISSIRV